MEEMDQTLHKNKTPAKKEHPYAELTQNKPHKRREANTHNKQPT